MKSDIEDTYVCSNCYVKHFYFSMCHIIKKVQHGEALFILYFPHPQKEKFNMTPMLCFSVCCSLINPALLFKFPVRGASGLLIF